MIIITYLLIYCQVPLQGTLLFFSDDNDDIVIANKQKKKSLESPTLTNVMLELTNINKYSKFW